MATPREDQEALRSRVTAAFRAEAERAAAGLDAAASPPSLPPLCAAGWPVSLPRPEPPGFLPPASSLLTVAQARRSDSASGTPRQTSDAVPGEAQVSVGSSNPVSLKRRAGCRSEAAA